MVGKKPSQQFQLITTYAGTCIRIQTLSSPQQTLTLQHMQEKQLHLATSPVKHKAIFRTSTYGSSWKGRYS